MRGGEQVQKVGTKRVCERVDGVGSMGRVLYRENMEIVLSSEIITSRCRYGSDDCRTKAPGDDHVCCFCP